MGSYITPSAKCAISHPSDNVSLGVSTIDPCVSIIELSITEISLKTNQFMNIIVENNRKYVQSGRSPPWQPTVTKSPAGSNGVGTVV